MDTLSTEQRSERMARVKSSGTKPEKQIRRMVWSLGHRYRKNKRYVVGKPDISFVGRKQAIFPHGCFWHRHDCPSGRRSPKSRLDFWSLKFERNAARDAEVAKQLAVNGGKSLVIWGCELRNTKGVIRRLSEFLDA